MVAGGYLVDRSLCLQTQPILEACLMGFMLPKVPPPNISMLPKPPKAPVFGQEAPGAQLRQQGQQAQAKAFGGSLMGTQLQAANIGGKTLLGQSG